MLIEDLHLWKFETTPTEGCLIECPSCKGYAPHSDWEESFVYCEDCGEHTALRCPYCKHCIDHVWQDEPLRIKYLGSDGSLIPFGFIDFNQSELHEGDSIINEQKEVLQYTIDGGYILVTNLANAYLVNSKSKWTKR